MRIKCLAQGNNILLPGFEQSTSVSKTDILTSRPICSRDLDDDCDGSHLTSFGIEFQTEEEAKENELSPSVASLFAGLLSRGMVYELVIVLRVCDGFFCSMSAIYDGAVLLWQW